MTLSIYDATIPVLVRGLGILSGLLRQGEAHAEAAGHDPSTLIGARLAPDMLTLAGQVQRASDTAKFAASRLIGTDAPAFPDDETSFVQLHARIARTVTYLQGFEAGQMAGGEARAIVLGSGGTARHFVGTTYVLQFVLPNFFFHVTTAYDILRHNGVPLGKRDYLWPVA